MSARIEVVDPAACAPVEPVPGLLVRTAFERGGRRLELLRVAPGERTGWVRRDGQVAGWVRAGDGRLEWGPGTPESLALAAGEFLRVPAGTLHRYAAGERALECLVVADCETAVRPGEESAGSPVSDATGHAVTTGRPEVVGPDGLSPAAPTPQLTRETPFPPGDLAVLRVRAAGGAAAGWHHHGGNVYFGYAVDGPSETEYGPDGERVARIAVGECFHVPPGLVHRDTNPTDEAHTGIVFLCGGAPWVENVDGPE